MRAISAVLAILLSTAPAAAGGLPVTFECDDPRDGLYEAITVQLRNLHVTERVPVTFKVVPCGIGSALDPYQCVNNTGFRFNWGAWMRANPDLIDVGQHGNNHNEVLSSLTRAGQLDLIGKGLQEMQTWGLPDGRPFSFASPFAAANADTISVLEELGFRTSAKNSGDCEGSSALDVYCESVPLCELNAQGGRVSGPSCVIKPPETLIAEVNARAADGKVFVVYHPQDLALSDLTTIDPTKIDALRAVLQAFRDQEIAGNFDLMTFDTHYRVTHGLPTPGSGPLATPTPTRTPTPAPTSTPPPVITPSAGDLSIYQDSLAAPWRNASWSATVDFNSTARPFSGTRSIRVAEVGWGALSLHSGSWGAPQVIDPRAYSAIDFVIYAEGGGMNVGVQLENEAGDAFPAVSAGAAPVGAWRRITIPMSQLAPSGRLFDRIDIMNLNGTNVTYFVDDLRLVGSGTGTPTPTPTRTPTLPPPTPTATRTPTSIAPPATPTATSPPVATATPTPTSPPATPSPTPTSGATAPQWIYQESLVSPWINASWQATVDFNNSTRAFNGSRSIRVVETGWGALSVHSGPWTATQNLDPALYQSVDLVVWSESPNFRLSVRLENDAREAFPEIPFGTIPVGAWTRVSVPMSQLNPSGRSFARVDVRNYNGTDVTYSVDDFALVRR